MTDHCTRDSPPTNVPDYADDILCRLGLMGVGVGSDLANLAEHNQKPADRDRERHRYLFQRRAPMAHGMVESAAVSLTSASPRSRILSTQEQRPTPCRLGGEVRGGAQARRQELEFAASWASRPCRHSLS